jgi:2-oxoisovalerate dehydrogenase E1 component alpha subunit
MDQATRDLVLKEFEAAETVGLPATKELFTDVYDKLTPNLEDQWVQVQEHLKKYPDEYKIKL